MKPWIYAAEAIRTKYVRPTSLARYVSLLRLVRERIVLRLVHNECLYQKTGLGLGPIFAQPRNGVRNYKRLVRKNRDAAARRATSTARVHIGVHWRCQVSIFLRSAGTFLLSNNNKRAWDRDGQILGLGRGHIA